jgi:hypothetical protein
MRFVDALDVVFWLVDAWQLLGHFENATRRK